MGFKLFLRICHVTKNTQHYTTSRFSITQPFSFLLSTLLSSILVCTPLHAESDINSNVAGDEIIIYSDDSFKPAIRDLGNIGDPPRNEAVQKETAKKSANPANSSTTNSTYSNSSPSAYGSGESVAPKSRGGRLGEALDTTLNETTTPAAESSDEIIKVDNEDLWQRIKSGYAMPDSKSNLTAKHEQWYSSRPDYVKRMVERSQKYLFHIVEEVEKRGMPTEIALLPMIESAYNPQAYSTSRASGIWQFVPSTGKFFGLKQNWWVDNRRNITVATDAALTYLEKLHGMFGAWDLALAAYNAGEGTVARAIERNRKLGLPTDYESLNLPPETKNYVPKLQAVKNLMTNPGNYGLNIQTIANTPYFAKVSAPAQIDAHLAAKLAEITDDEFLALNPSYNRPVITSDNKNLELLLPILSAQTFRTNLASYNKPLVSWQTYFAKRGERIDKIASKFGIQLGKLRDVNDLPAQSKIKKTATILVPNGNRTEFNAEKPKLATTTEAMPSIETNNSPNTEQATLSNQISANIDTTGTQPINTETEPSPSSHITHKVKKGELMRSIAKRYGVSVKQIMAENALKSSRIKVGQVLSINTESNEKTTKNTTSKNKSKNQTYIVKRGDTLHSIAEKFDVAVADLKRWNKKYSTHIQPGNKINILQSDAG